jgi:hypothetical protein
MLVCLTTALRARYRRLGPGARLVDVVIAESLEGRTRLSVDFFGALAGIIAVSAGSKKAVRMTPDGLQQISVVAGAHNSQCSTSLGCGFRHEGGRVPGKVQDSMQI